MKRLTVLRHAKAASRSPLQRDFDRQLTEDGRAVAARMGVFMKGRGLAPDCVLCSPAARTRETLALVLAEIKPAAPAAFPDRLYNAPPMALLGAVNAASNACGHILLIGHNPGLHLFALEFAQPDGPHADALMRLGANFPPGALAYFECDIASWLEAGPGRGALKAFKTPKELHGDVTA